MTRGEFAIVMCAVSMAAAIGEVIQVGAMAAYYITSFTRPVQMPTKAEALLDRVSRA